MGLQNLRSAALASLAALGMAASLTAASAATTVHFTVAEYSSKTGPFFKDMAAAFEKKNPDVKVDIEVVPWNNLLQRLTTDIAGGTAPDIAIIGTRWLNDFAAQHVAEPLDGYIKPEFKATFVDTFMTPSIMNGKVMGLPVAASARAMMINKDLFDKAGATPPKTWDELYDAAKKISKLPDTFGFGLQGKEIETDAYYYYALWSFGGDILTKDGKSGLRSQEALDAANFYKKMIDDKLTQPSPTNYTRENVFDMFKQGKLGVIFTFPMLIPQVKAEAPKMHYEILPFPKGKAQATYGVTDTLMMFSSSKVKDAAWKFIEFAYQADWRDKFDKNEGFLPILKANAAEDYYTKNPDIAAFAAGLPYAKFAPIISNWEEIADTTVQALQKIYLGQEAPKAALTEAADKIDAIRAKK
jgi:multiple sugar transport system substrate-binding protein